MAAPWTSSRGKGPMPRMRKGSSTMLRIVPTSVTWNGVRLSPHDR